MRDVFQSTGPWRWLLMIVRKWYANRIILIDPLTWEDIIIALAQKEIALLTPSPDSYQRSCWDGLVLVIEYVYKRGGKLLLGRFRKQINCATKQIPVLVAVWKQGRIVHINASERAVVWNYIMGKSERVNPRNYGKIILTEHLKICRILLIAFLQAMRVCWVGLYLELSS